MSPSSGVSGPLGDTRHAEVKQETSLFWFLGDCSIHTCVCVSVSVRVCVSRTYTREESQSHMQVARSPILQVCDRPAPLQGKWGRPSWPRVAEGPTRPC